MSITFLRIVAVLAAIFALPDAARSGEPHWPETLTIGTGSPGGTYYDYGDGLVKLLTRKLDVPVFMRPTEGPTENIKLLEAGEIQLAFVTLGRSKLGTDPASGRAASSSARCGPSSRCTTRRSSS
jgi:TRAP-type uncharacterized transport system substrate-binding protein